MCNFSFCCKLTNACENHSNAYWKSWKERKIILNITANICVEKVWPEIIARSKSNALNLILFATHTHMQYFRECFVSFHFMKLVFGFLYLGWSRECFAISYVSNCPYHARANKNQTKRQRNSSIKRKKTGTFVRIFIQSVFSLLFFFFLFYS